MTDEVARNLAAAVDAIRNLDRNLATALLSLQSELTDLVSAVERVNLILNEMRRPGVDKFPPPLRE